MWQVDASTYCVKGGQNLILYKLEESVSQVIVQIGSTWLVTVCYISPNGCVSMKLACLLTGIDRGWIVLAEGSSSMDVVEDRRRKKIEARWS